jgi:HD superfamily phosphohydrolase
MPKSSHEIRDPIHGFVRLDPRERRIVDQWPVQRLRHVHQLALSYLVYPGATHRRFEHSLGVLELSGRVFDVVTQESKLSSEVRELIPEISDPAALAYWRRALRLAALCHDLGHPPFSHAAEKALFPERWDHERMTKEILESGFLDEALNEVPPIRREHVVKLAVGPAKAKDLMFSNWEALLSEIIVGDAFGVDRMDYLLRDSHHAGVIYGRFDQIRLIDTLRILPAPSGPDQLGEPQLGVEYGGLQSAEALLLGRYFMYSQVYFHPVRIVYDLHLIDFLRCWRPSGFPTSVDEHLALTDNEPLAAMTEASRDSSNPCHELARRIVERNHFKLLYHSTQEDRRLNPAVGEAVFEAAGATFGSDAVRYERRDDKGGSVEFPVLMNDGRVGSSLSEAHALRVLQPVTADYVFIEPVKRDVAKNWLQGNREELIKPKEVVSG